MQLSSITSPNHTGVVNTMKMNKIASNRSTLSSHSNIGFENLPQQTNKSIFSHPINNSMHSTKYQHRSSPPFRIGGRGTKQLTKVLQQTEDLICDSDSNDKSGMNWALCISSPVCFAKIVSITSHDKTMIQPLRLNPIDSTLLIPWEGHVWLTKNENLVPVEMKKEALGYRVQMTPFIRQWIETLSKTGEKSSYPISLQSAIAKKNDDWDMVSLESSEMDDGNSVIFPYLSLNSTMLNTRKVEDITSIKMPLLIPSIHSAASVHGDDAESENNQINISDNNNNNLNVVANIFITKTFPIHKIQSENDQNSQENQENKRYSDIQHVNDKKEVIPSISIPNSPRDQEIIEFLGINTPSLNTKVDESLGIYSVATTNSTITQDSRILSGKNYRKSRSSSLDETINDDNYSDHSFYLGDKISTVTRNENEFIPNPFLNSNNVINDNNISDLGLFCLVEASETCSANIFSHHDESIVNQNHNRNQEILNEPTSNLTINSTNATTTTTTNVLESKNVGIAMKRKMTRKRKNQQMEQPLVVETVSMTVVEDIKPPRPSRGKTMSYQEREAMFGSWVSRSQSAANGSYKL